MAAELGGLLVGAQHDRQRVPADERPDVVVEDQLLRVQPVFLAGRDGVQVRRGGAVRDRCPLAAGLLDHLVKQKERAVGALERHHRVKRIHPLAGLGRVKIFQHRDPFIDGANPCRAGARSTVIVPPAATIRYVPKTAGELPGDEAGSARSARDHPGARLGNHAGRKHRAEPSTRYPELSTRRALESRTSHAESGRLASAPAGRVAGRRLPWRTFRFHKAVLMSFAALQLSAHTGRRPSPWAGSGRCGGLWRSGRSGGQNVMRRCRFQDACRENMTFSPLAADAGS